MEGMLHLLSVTFSSELKLNMFGIKGKLLSTKQKVFSLFRLIGNLGNEDSDVSSPNSVFTDVPYVPVYSFKNYAIEAEVAKAEALFYYKTLLDRLK